jgi:hypothetical protein
MPAPSSITFSADAISAANTALLGVIDASASAATVTLRSEADVALAVFTCDQPAGTVDGTSGVLTLALVADEVAASASGTATWAEIADGDDLTVISMPCVQGVDPVAGSCVLTSTALVEAGLVALVSITFG